MISASLKSHRIRQSVKISYLRKASLKFYVLGVVLIIKASASLFAQGLPAQDFSHDYFPIQAVGEVPFDFINHWYAFDDFHDQEKSIENYQINQYYSTRSLVNSGKFSFGDPITNYLEGIKNELLKNDQELADTIRIYLYRGASPGLGFMMSTGMIGISNGLIASLGSKAELAFVIAHEIAHFKLSHAWESYSQGKLNEDDLDKVELIENQLIRSKKQEGEADSLGLIIFKNAGYETPAAIDCLKHLYETYHPFGRCDVDADLFQLENEFKLPQFYLREKVDPIATDYSYQDRRHTHPNIEKRISLIEAMDKNAASSPSSASADAEFNAIQELCKMETVHWQVLERDYLNAFYNSNCLLQKYPQNRFLRKSNIRAVYGMVVLKVANRRINDLLVDPKRIPGPVQELHHLLRNFNTPQLVALSRTKVLDYLQQFPEDQEVHEILQNINRILQEDPSMRDIYATLLKPKPDLNPILDSSLTERQKHIKLKYQLADFYLYLLADLSDSASISNFIKPYKGIKDSLDLVNQLKEDPYNFNLITKVPDKVVMISPNIFPYARELWLMDFQTVRQIEVDVKDRLGEYRAANAAKLDMLYRLEWERTSVADYNRMSAVKALVQEAEDFNHFGYSTARSHQKYLFKEGPLEYLTLSDALYNIDGSDWYRFRLFNMKTGAMLYQREDKKGSEISDREIANGIMDDLQEIGLLER